MQRTRRLVVGAVSVAALVVGGATAALAANTGRNAMAQTYLRETTPTALGTYSVPQHTDAKAIQFGGQTIQFERVTLPGGKLGIGRRTGSSISSLGSPTVVISPGALGKGCSGVYAPYVIINPANTSQLVIAYEADPWNAIGQPGTGYCAGENTSQGQYIGMAVSNDGGVTWSGFKKVMAIARGAGGANVGTPAIHQWPGQNNLVLSYHRNPGSNGALQRRARVLAGTNADPSGIPLCNAIGAACAGEQLITVNGLGNFNKGVGRADILWWQSNMPGGVPPYDGYFYMVFEAFNGTSACLVGGGTNRNRVLMARATSITGPYTTISNTLGAWWAPLNTVTCAGPDMPSWYVEANQNPKIITTDDVNGSAAGGHFLKVWNTFYTP